jgi:hypothetical protein
MLLHVESHAGPNGEREPFAFLIGERRIDVVCILDRWIGDDHRYYKIEASDLALYILRFTPSEKKWELTLFQAPSH